MHREFRVYYRPYAVLCAAILCATAIFLLSRGRQKFQQDDYAMAVDTIRSTSRAAQLLLAQASSGRLSQRFVSGQMRYFNRTVSDTLRTIHAAEDAASLEPRLAALGRLAVEVANDIRAASNAQPPEWPSFEQRLALLAADAEELRAAP
jgi:hypothetical protein